MKIFWKWLAKYAYRKIKDPVTAGLGFPGLRDPKHPCDYYSPRNKIRGDADCQSDGHYLCRNCALYDWDSNEQMFTQPEKFN